MEITNTQKVHIQWLEEGKDNFLEEITEGFPRKCCFLEFLLVSLGLKRKGELLPLKMN